MKSLPNSEPDETGERILRSPAKSLMRYCEEKGIELSYGLGMIAVALELESQARIFEAIEGTSLVALNRDEIATALRSLLRSLQLDDATLEWYGRIVKHERSKRPTYVAVDPSDTVLGRYDDTLGVLGDAALPRQGTDE